MSETHRYPIDDPDVAVPFSRDANPAARRCALRFASRLNGTALHSDEEGMLSLASLIVILGVLVLLSTVIVGGTLFFELIVPVDQGPGQTKIVEEFAW